MLDCPVCARAQITEESCPQCSVDLKPLLRFAQLRAELDKPTQPAPAPKPRPYLAAAAFAAGLAGIPIWIVTHPPVIKTVIVKEPAMPAGAPPDTPYTIKRGDSFWSIAKQKYGMGEMWKMIRDDNKDRRKLHPGDVIRLRTVTLAPK